MYKLLLLLTLTTSVFAKNYTIDFTIKDTKQDKFTLSLKLGEKYTAIKNELLKNNKVSFILDDTSPKGFYQISGGGFALDFIFNHQDVDIVSTHTKPIINAKILKDRQNKDYYKLLISRDTTNKRRLIVNLLNYHPKDSEFYKTLISKNNYLFTNDFKITKQKILTENLKYNTLLTTKLKDDDNFKKLRQEFKDTNISLEKLFNDFAFNDFAVHSNMVSKRLNLYLLQAYLKNKEDKKVQKTNVMLAKDDILKFFKSHNYNTQIIKIVDDILAGVDL